LQFVPFCRITGHLCAFAKNLGIFNILKSSLWTRSIINLYDEYTHANLNTRSLFEKARPSHRQHGHGIVIAPLLESNYAKAATVQEDDDELETETISYNVNGITMYAYTAKPKKNQYGWCDRDT
jgi:hypothetical protein